MADIDSESPPLPSPHSKLNLSSNGGTETPSQLDGLSEEKPSNRKIEKLRSSANHSRRRSPRLVGGESVESGNSDALLGKSPLPKKRKVEIADSFFIGAPVPEEEAQRRWPWRYEKNEGLENSKKSLKQETEDDDDEKLVLNVKCHYSQAKILKTVFDLGDCALVKGPTEGSNYVGKILEFFKTIDGEDYIRVQWFFRAEDTVIKDEAKSHDKKRLFHSTLMNDNLLDCLVSKVKVVHVAPNLNLNAKTIPPCDFYFDMEYSVDYSTFSRVITDNNDQSSPHSHPLPTSTIKKDETHKNGAKIIPDEMSNNEISKPVLALLDMYSGCGGMSTGLCFGAKACGVDLVARWAVDMDKAACESLKQNHRGTQVRNDSAEDFLDLLKEWDRICKRFVNSEKKEVKSRVTREADKSKSSKANPKSSCEYEVEKLVDICFGDPNKTGKRSLMFQVRWIGYGPSDDTWEPMRGLSNCPERIRDFVLRGMKAKILPRPGDVAVICGGPPCQGISGSNRFRNFDSPLDDEKNRQIIIFMDIIDFLKPKYVLMENVIDILKFANGCLGRYAISRLVRMRYQARVGIMAAGCYGLPQFRLRVFLWGAHPDEILPQFPLPTHDVVIQYGFPSEFERNVVAYDEGQPWNLEKHIVLNDAISDLPPVENDEKRDKMMYTKAPETKFQEYIRAAKKDMTASPSNDTSTADNLVLHDHLPHPLNEEDYMRVCRIPKQKGANFRDLPGIVIGSDNAVRRTTEPSLMPSGKPWVPEYAINFRDGKSTRPFARLWWDETVPTVFCLPDPHTRAVLHPEQDRLLTLRECARLQGFHDHYKFCGKLKERYSQVGNAVAVSVGRALGYSLGIAIQKLNGGDKHLLTLPNNFSHSTTVELLSQLQKPEQ